MRMFSPKASAAFGSSLPFDGGRRVGCRLSGDRGSRFKGHPVTERQSVLSPRRFRSMASQNLGGLREELGQLCWSRGRQATSRRRARKQLQNNCRSTVRSRIMIQRAGGSMAPEQWNVAPRAATPLMGLAPSTPDGVEFPVPRGPAPLLPSPTRPSSRIPGWQELRPSCIVWGTPNLERSQCPIPNRPVAAKRKGASQPASTHAPRSARAPASAHRSLARTRL